MKKQKYNCRFMGFDREIYEKLRDFMLTHQAMNALKNDTVDFLINFKRYTKNVPLEFHDEIKRIAKSLMKTKEKDLFKAA